MSNNPYAAVPEAISDHQFSEMARRKCRAPGILLIISGVIAIATNLIGGLSLAGLYLGAQEQVLQQIRQQQNQQIDQDVLITFMNLYGYCGIAFAVLGLIGGVFIIFGGIQMIRLRGWIFAVLGAVVSIIPCSQGCCVVGVPVGIWCLVVLMDSAVKPSFDS